MFFQVVSLVYFGEKLILRRTKTRIYALYLIFYTLYLLNNIYIYIINDVFLTYPKIRVELNKRNQSLFLYLIKYIFVCTYILKLLLHSDENLKGSDAVAFQSWWVGSFGVIRVLKL